LTDQSIDQVSGCDPLSARLSLDAVDIDSACCVVSIYAVHNLLIAASVCRPTPVVLPLVATSISKLT